MLERAFYRLKPSSLRRRPVKEHREVRQQVRLLTGYLQSREVPEVRVELPTAVHQECPAAVHQEVLPAQLVVEMLVPQVRLLPVQFLQSEQPELRITACMRLQHFLFSIN